MSDIDEYRFYRMRVEGKSYISTVFSFNQYNTERVRNIRMVIDGCEEIHLGEIEGAMCLRISGIARKTQVTALVSQDHKQVKRLTLQKFKSNNANWIDSVEKDEFTFSQLEFKRILEFLNSIKFIDLSNEDNFQIEDISTGVGAKAIIDASDRSLIERFNQMSEVDRNQFIQGLRSSLTVDDINTILGRKEAIRLFDEKLNSNDWSEKDWQDFFQEQQWVFGYGLDYRIMRTFDREMTVGVGGSDNLEKPIVDFLMTFKKYTVLVEIKKPSTKIFRSNRSGRAGTWEFSREFMNSVSQVLEQKAEWLSFSQENTHFNKAGTERLYSRTKNARTILIIGSDREFESDNSRDDEIKRDTFELFRLENRNIEILTFDEIYERASFILNNNPK